MKLGGYEEGGGEGQVREGLVVYLQAVPVHARLSQAFGCHVRRSVQALRGTPKQILLSGVWLFGEEPKRC